MGSSNDAIKECLQKQLDEMDLLSSIYCNPGELQVLDYSSIAEITEFVKGKTTYLAQTLDFIVTLTTDDECKIEIRAQLPHNYPHLESPYVTVRSTSFSKNQEAIIKRKVQEYIDKECDKSETYIFQVISWVQDNTEEFKRFNDNKQETKSDTSTSSQNSLIEMERLWIYSHHIKSKTKRQNIIKISRDLKLSGFMRPGKPGIICVEGRKEDTQYFWRTIKQWNWHKITLRKVESDTKTKSNVDSHNNFQIFDAFKEYLFTTSEENDEEVPMDMSQFMKFLDTHNCTYIKEYLFSF